MNIEVDVKCSFDPEAGLRKRGDEWEEWHRSTVIRSKFLITAGQTFKELYEAVADRHPEFRPGVENGRFLLVLIHSREEGPARYMSGIVKKIPKAAWGIELRDGDTVMFMHPPPG